MSPSSRRQKSYAFFGALFFTAALGLIMIQERLIFFPEKLPIDYNFKFERYSEKSFEFESLKINSILFSEEKSNVLVLYFHGNAGSLSSWGEVASELRDRLKVNVWILDYPGYGKSEGSIQSERQLLDLAESFYVQAQNLFPQKKIVVYGRSIGSGPATWLATQHKLPLILESPFVSFSKLASEHAPWFPSFLRRYSFEVSTWLKGFSNSLLLIHGDRDEVIPVHHSQMLVQKFPLSHYAEVNGASHNNLSSFDRYWGALRALFSELQ